MSRLVLHFTDSTLFLLEYAQQKEVAQTLPLESDKPFARERMSGPIKKALENHSLQRVLWFSPHFTLFPRALFDPNQLEAYYQLNQGQLPSNQYLTHQILAELDLVLIYSIPVWLYDYAKYDLQTPHVQHSVSRQLAHLSAQNPKDKVVLLLEAAHFVLIAIKDSKLMCCTANEYQQNTDILYFLLAHQQKLQLPPLLDVDIYDASQHFDFPTFESLLGQFKDFEQYNCTFYETPTYQNQILCASSEDH